MVGQGAGGLSASPAVRKEQHGHVRRMDRYMPVVVPLAAEIDLTNAEDVADQIGAAFGPGVTAVIADLTATTFCDSSGLRHLLLASGRASASGGQLLLVIPSSSPVRRILTFTRADQMLAIYPTLDDALSAESSPGRQESLEGTTEEPPTQSMTT
jgi:anti-sigma B factor antagonist